MSQLDLMTTDELVKELKKRFPLFLMAGSAHFDQADNYDCLYYYGDIMSLMGLASLVHDDLLQQYKAGSEVADDNP